LRLVAPSRIAEPRPTRTGSSTETAAVRLDSVTRMFGATPALVRADLTVARGEVLLVRGPNGAGKTTLLRIIATAISPTYGGGTVLGHDLAAGREEIRRRTELVGHHTRLYEDLTALENLRFTCAMHGLDPGGAEAILDRVGLSRVARHRVAGFSQGMRQRAAMARAIARRPDLLLLDDPFAGLDAAGRAVLEAEIAGARAQGRTVIVAAPDPAAEAMATRVVHMEEGRPLP
jgi:heme exporter protein A